MRAGDIDCNAGRSGEAKSTVVRTRCVTARTSARAKICPASRFRRIVQGRALPGVLHTSLLGERGGTLYIFLRRRGWASYSSGVEGGPGPSQGVDSTDDDSTAAIPFARELAKRTGAAVAISDVISVAGGDATMTRVTGVGCALGALMAAFLATADPLRAASQRRLSLLSPVNAPRRAHSVREVSR
jgi:hypothetical protein